MKVILPFAELWRRLYYLSIAHAWTGNSKKKMAAIARTFFLLPSSFFLHPFCPYSFALSASVMITGCFGTLLSRASISFMPLVNGSAI